MIFSTKRMYAIFQKDLKDLSKNMFVGTTMLMPIVLAAIYGAMGLDSIEIHYMMINLTFVAVTVFIQSAIIAEEKEKNTLRNLMLSPATLTEILTGKSLVSFILTVITIVICAFLTEYEPASLLPVALAILLSSVFYLILGTLLGLLSRSVVEASVLFTPVLFIFGFGSMVLGFAEDYPILSIVEYLPNVQIIQFAEKVEAGTAIAGMLTHLGIIALWVVGAAIATAIVYRKKEMD